MVEVAEGVFLDTRRDRVVAVEAGVDDSRHELVAGGYTPGTARDVVAIPQDSYTYDSQDQGRPQYSRHGDNEWPRWLTLGFYTY